MDNQLCLRKNVGTVDRVIRLVLGAALIVLPALLLWAPWAVALLAAAGGALALEGLIGY